MISRKVSSRVAFQNWPIGVSVCRIVSCIPRGMRDGTSHECAYKYGRVAPLSRIRRLSTGSVAETPSDCGASVTIAWPSFSTRIFSLV